MPYLDNMETVRAEIPGKLVVAAGLDADKLSDQARSLRDLAAIPGNRLEALKGTKKGQHSIRINDQYRICFAWQDGDACDVEITGYH